MNCRAVQRRLSAYVDGELSGVEMLAVRRHVARCRACEAEFEAERAVKARLAACCDVPIPLGLENRLVEHVLRAGRGAQRQSAFAFGAVILGAAAAIATVAFLSEFERKSAAVRQVHEADSLEMARDQAYMERYDPLGGGAGVIVVNHAGYRR